MPVEAHAGAVTLVVTRNFFASRFEPFRNRTELASHPASIAMYEDTLDSE
jgi:hypothetical protein